LVNDLGVDVTIRIERVAGGEPALVPLVGLRIAGFKCPLARRADDLDEYHFVANQIGELGRAGRSPGTP
jgi:hypothetical protein